MTEKPTLLIDGISEKAFSELKKKSLDAEILGDDTLKEIERLFGVGDESTGSVHCDEYHGHSYSCVAYKHPSTGIVNRLIMGIKMYKGKLSKIKEHVSQQ